MSSAEFGVVGAERVEDFAGEVAFLASDDFGHGQALGGSAIGLRGS